MKQVYILSTSKAHFVMVASRKKYQNHSVAQFDARNITVEKVEKWIKENNYEQIAAP